MFDIAVNGNQMGLQTDFTQNGHKSATGKDVNEKAAMHHHQRTVASHFATQDNRQQANSSVY